MEKKNKNKLMIGLLIGIIIMLLIFIYLFATNTITLNSKNNNTNKTQENSENLDINEENTQNSNADIYTNFLNSKEYLKEVSEADNGAVNDVKYAYYNLNNDGIEELIIYLPDDNFGTHLFYTYNNNEIKLISKIYHYGNLVYNPKESAIVYTEVRPSQAYGYAYGFYKLNNNKFDLIKTVGVEIEDEKETYFVDNQTITKEEYDKYFENNINFDYQELN